VPRFVSNVSLVNTCQTTKYVLNVIQARLARMVKAVVQIVLLVTLPMMTTQHVNPVILGYTVINVSKLLKVLVKVVQQEHIHPLLVWTTLDCVTNANLAKLLPPVVIRSVVVLVCLGN